MCGGGLGFLGRGAGGLYVYSLQSVLFSVSEKRQPLVYLSFGVFFPLSLRLTLVSLNMLNSRFSFEENCYIYSVLFH